VLGASLGDSLGEVLGEVLGAVLGEVLGPVLGMELGDSLEDVLVVVLGRVLGKVIGEVLGAILGDVLGAVLLLGMMHNCAWSRRGRSSVLTLLFFFETLAVSAVETSFCEYCFWFDLPMMIEMIVTNVSVALSCI
jgi:hypothetical protein